MPFQELDRRVEQVRLGHDDTPHGRAQRALDAARETAMVVGQPARIEATEGPDGFIYNIQAGTVSFPDTQSRPPNKTVPANLPTGPHEATTHRRRKSEKPGKYHDFTNLNGFYKGTFFRDGRAQHPKR